MAFRVVVAGGGIAGLEGVLALRQLCGERVEIQVLAPEDEFRFRQLAVAEPFALGEVSAFPLTELIEDAGAEHVRAALAEVRPEERLAVTREGEELAYDALLLALGARATDALPGAITYRGEASNAEVHGAILALHRGEIDSLAFAVPPKVRWALPLYELALLSAAHLADIGDGGATIRFITHESAPLASFGSRASSEVSGLLESAGIDVRTGVAPARFEAGALELMDGERISAGRAIALPALEAQPIPGVPQGPHGFIDTDRLMRVERLERVFAAGDATWFPIKQGGLAAQQADAAASAIAAMVDPEVELEPFRPVLRAALLTGSGPYYMRATIGEQPERASGPAPLWWPPVKVAGRLLAPFIADHAARTNQPEPPLADIEIAPGREAEAAEGHRDAVELALAAADADAREGDLHTALRWLAVAEGLDLTLPPEYALKREDWQRQLGEQAH